MKTISFPFRIVDGKIVVDDNYYSPLLEINHLLQMYNTNEGERFYNLQQTGMLKSFLFQNMSDMKKSEIIKILKQVADDQTNKVVINEIEIFTLEEMKKNGMQGADLVKLNNYDQNTYFINIIFTTVNTSITTNMVMSEFGDVFTAYQGL